jgi:hypothetical protein
MKKPEPVFHVEFRNGSHLYFGSIAAIYEVFNANTIGVTAKGLYNFNIEENKPYRNEKCAIRKGNVVRKKTNRKNGKTKLNNSTQ